MTRKLRGGLSVRVLPELEEPGLPGGLQDAERSQGPGQQPWVLLWTPVYARVIQLFHQPSNNFQNILSLDLYHGVRAGQILHSYNKAAVSLTGWGERVGTGIESNSTFPLVPTIETSFFSSSMSLSFLAFLPFLSPCSETAAGSYLSRPTCRGIWERRGCE